MSGNDRLQALSGVYKQNDGNTFVILVQGDKLTLKTDEIHNEELKARGDGLYDVLNTNAKIKFHMGPSGIASSITFYLPDRQTVATRDVQVLKEKTLSEKFKELGFAGIVFFALLGIFFISYIPMKNACLQGGSAFICRTAMISARIMGRTEDTQRLASQESKKTYNQSAEDNKEACEKGEARACLEEAKSFARINKKAEAIKLLEDNCYNKKDGPSCQYWRDFMLAENDVDKANSIMKTSCDFGVALGCHELAWKFKKEQKNAESLTYFDKACELGEEKSCYELGLHHLKYDRERSLNYLISSCRGYHRQACDLRDKVEKYLEQKKKCLNENDAQACFLMASFEQDYGDKLLALEQYKKACELGNNLACNIVKTDAKVKELKKSGNSIDTI